LYLHNETGKIYQKLIKVITSGEKYRANGRGGWLKVENFQYVSFIFFCSLTFTAYLRTNKINLKIIQLFIFIFFEKRM
jgi:hypothetical protein